MAHRGADSPLTPVEKRLIEALLEPANRFKTVSEICDIVKCARNSYYRAFDKPYFRVEYEKRSADLAKKHLGPIMNAFVKQAISGSFQHGKVLLEMAGVYVEKAKAEISGPGGGPITWVELVKVAQSDAESDS